MKVKKAANHDLSVYPNPVSANVLNLNFEGKHIQLVEVYSLNGSRLWNKEMSKVESTYQLDLGGLNKGGYLIRILTNEGWIVKKITKL